MNPWSTYSSRMGVRGGNRRGIVKRQEEFFLNHTMRDSLSFQQLVIDGEPREMTVLDSDNLNEKTLCTLPGETLRAGSLVEWADNHWLITELDAHSELYTKAYMQQCNYLLRWVAPDYQVVERWCIIEDGTKYLTGEYTDNQFIITRGDARVSLILAKDEYSIQLGRTNRFLIDDWDTHNTLAYRLTKPFKLGYSFNGEGVLGFVLTECATEESDNFERHIANYYDYFPRVSHAEDSPPPDVTPSDGPIQPETGKKVWL